MGSFNQCQSLWVNNRHDYYKLIYIMSTSNLASDVSRVIEMNLVSSIHGSDSHMIIKVAKRHQDHQDAMANSSGIDKHSKLQTIFRFFGSSSVSHLKYPKLIGFILHFSFFWWDRFIPQNLLLVGQLPPCQCCSSLHCRGIDIIIGCQNEENCFVHLYFALFH